MPHLGDFDNLVLFPATAVKPISIIALNAITISVIELIGLLQLLKPTIDLAYTNNTPAAMHLALDDDFTYDKKVTCSHFRG